MQTRNLVGGRWIGSLDGREMEVRDPATGAVVASVPRGGGPETRAAVDAAWEAFPAWSRTVALERGRLLRRFAALLLERREELAVLLTREQGKPLAEARGEIAYGASFLDWAAGEAPRVQGDILPASSPDRRILVLRQPVGVVAAITPWNFPNAMITRKIGPALAAGCTVVVKPAEQTPLSALALAELAEEAGFPPGTVNVVTGDPQPIGAAMLDDPRVRRLSFTGSIEVGRLLARGAARHLTRLSLELGGHAPFLVFDDADLDAAVAGAMASKFRNMGQTCICANRFLVQEGIYPRFVEALGRAISELRLGPGLEEGVQVGPLVDDAAVEKVRGHVADAVERGATVTVGGGLAAMRPGLAPRFFQPTLVEGLDPTMRMWREETFGPVAPVRAFRDEAEAISLANDSRHGLAAYFFTRDAARLLRVAEALEYGVIGANDGSPSVAQAPFGGMKESGYGREGGRYAMDEVTELKYVSWRLDRASTP